MVVHIEVGKLAYDAKRGATINQEGVEAERRKASARTRQGATYTYIRDEVVSIVNMVWVVSVDGGPGLLTFWFG